MAGAGDVNGDGFGDVIAGAPLFDNGQTDEGRAYFYYGSAAGPAAAAAWTAESDQASGAMGYSIGSAGDVNGDGYGDLFIGVPFFDTGAGADAGRVLVFHGSAGGPAAVANWIADGGQANARFGYSSAGAGDVNGDGYTDLIVGAYLYDNGQTDEGRAFVYLGSPAGLAATPAWTTEANQTGAQLGNSVASAGDVNGDGYGDVIVGAYSYDNGQADEGRAFVFLGSPAGLAATAAWTAESNQAGALFGAPVASAGDVNGDGFSDLLVGAWQYDAAGSNTGRAYVYLGSASGPAPAPAWVADGDQTECLFGFPLSSAGDVNGDGFSDVIVGATGYDNTMTNEGRVYLYYGSAAGLSPAAGWIYSGDQDSASIGYVRAPGGDVNGDGYADIVVGAPYYNNVGVDEGRTFLFLGSASGPGAAPSWTADGNQTGALFGYACGGAGDINGDGFADIVVGATGFDNDLLNEGRAFLFYGNGGAGTTRQPRQVRPDGATPIDALGRSDSRTEFRLKGPGRTAAGRAVVGFQYEIKPLGAPFDGAGLQSSAPADTGAPSGSGSAASFELLVSGLTPGTPYRWRARTQSRSPFFPRSPWFYLPYNSAGETDLRTAICNDNDGDGYGSPGDPTCPGGSATDCNDADGAVHPGAAELCDNVDNDCNGSVDGFATACGTGACARTGSCTAGTDSCAPGAPSAETCDNIDNNCDGTVDGFATTCGLGPCAAAGSCVAGHDSCTPGPSSPETCDNIDNNCDGTVDGFATTCGLGPCAAAGSCVAGHDSCTPGAPRPRPATTSTTTATAPWTGSPPRAARAPAAGREPASPASTAARRAPRRPRPATTSTTTATAPWTGSPPRAGSGPAPPPARASPVTTRARRAPPRPRPATTSTTTATAPWTGSPPRAASGPAAGRASARRGATAARRAPHRPRPATTSTTTATAPWTGSPPRAGSGPAPPPARASPVTTRARRAPPRPRPATTSTTTATARWTTTRPPAASGPAAGPEPASPAPTTACRAPLRPKPATPSTTTATASLDNAPPPAGELLLSVTKTALSWTSMAPGVHYDVVRGSVQTLHATGGNFAASTGACIANNRSQSSVGFTTSPAAGEGFWILVRGTSGGCSNGVTSYDTGAASQVGYRDAGIAASPSACP